MHKALCLVQLFKNICVHELDARLIYDFETRMAEVTKAVDAFLSDCGIENPLRMELLRMYDASKNWFHSQPVDRFLRDGDIIQRDLRVIHGPIRKT